MEEITRRVLSGLMHCSKEPESNEDCGDCPYRKKDDDFCITRLCRDAYNLIVKQDKLIEQMEIEKRGDVK